MADLLDVLRETGGKLLEEEKPLDEELGPVVGALIAHLEAKLPGIADVAITDLEHKFTPQALAAVKASGQESTAHVPAPATDAAPGEVTQQSADAARIAELEAQLSAARATAPAITSEPAAPSTT